MRAITQFIWRKHALERMLERSITRNEVMECAYKGEIIESIPKIIRIPAFWFCILSLHHFISLWRWRVRIVILSLHTDRVMMNLRITLPQG